MTRLIRTVDEWREVQSKFQHADTLGFVPTMGALHEGHASLINRSIGENRLTVVSIFVNPTQFNNPADLTKYPRTEAADVDLLTRLKVDFLFMPDYASIYPDSYEYKVTEHKLSLLMEGTGRPGHFDGVLTVVMKLLNIIRPVRAYFGEKDYQQYLLVKKMAEAFFMEVEIIACPTIRNSDGLALSSRNILLSKEGRARAPLFAHLLQSDKTAEQIKAELEQNGFTVDYIFDVEGRRYGAVYLDGIRLIDNVKLNQ
ncbi:MAG: pantoate--beta-alanine ligase [Cyclobacteriaceae bacterium]